MQYALWRRGLSTNSPVKHIVDKAPLALLALVLLSALSCGKRGVPQPPEESVQQRVVLSGFQRGNQVILSWRMPARNAPPSSVQHIARVEVYRLAEPLNAPLTMSEEEFSARSVMIASLVVMDVDFGLKTMSYRDTLQFAGQPVRLRYSIRFVNASGQRAAFSNALLIEPSGKVANAPTSLAATVSQDAVTLRWTAPQQNVDGSTPVNVLGYNVYRSPSALEAAKLLNQTPVAQTSFEDRTFEFTKEFFYFVRAVSVGTGGEPVESLESPIVAVRPVDTFPPSAPASITIAATPTSISLFFPPNPETDIAGYRIYRSTDPNQPKTEWEELTREPQTANTYVDTRVESGRTYYYYITATDKFSNVSAPSEVVSETVP